MIGARVSSVSPRETSGSVGEVSWEIKSGAEVGAGCVRVSFSCL